MFSFFRARSKKQKSRTTARPKSALSYERLEVRNVLSTFSVVNLNDSGAGSLRQAMTEANNVAGADIISFQVAGTIQLTSGALPNVTDEVRIDGTTAPGFATSPTIEVDYNGHRGLKFADGSDGSVLRSMALVGASGAGVTLDGVEDILVAGNYVGLRSSGVAAGNKGQGIDLIDALNNTIGGNTAADRNVISANRKNGIRLKDSSFNTISGNYIGTTANGSGALGNGDDGIRLENSNGNVIGNTNAVSGIDIYNANDVPTQPVSSWQGIRAADTPGEYLIVGTSNDDGLLFEGTIEGVGTSYEVIYPGSLTTSVYGPDNLNGNGIRLVGTYKNSDFATAPVEVNAFLFEGTTADLASPSNYRTIDYPGAKFNFAHSTMGGLVVGNYDSAVEHGQFNLPLGPGHAYIYDILSNTFITDIIFPGSLSNTAYGIWYNGDTSYTICGGYSLTGANNLDDQGRPIGSAYLVDYDSATGLFTNWKSFDYSNASVFSHFSGISSVEKGVYTLAAGSGSPGSSSSVQGSWVSVRRNTDGTFGEAKWVFDPLRLNPSFNTVRSNSVFGDQIVGIVDNLGGIYSYQATINSGFQLSNVISANGGNGITLQKSNDNRIEMNFIGTNVAGTVDLGNAQNGILVKKSSARNLIGGEATGGNDPTDNVFVRPPQGNLISGNDANGVLINSKSTANQLSGNFIGTTASGLAALGNSLDGVAIHKADGNSLIGCTFHQDPFVFYNVISGNGGNGLRVKSADDTTIQANFFGLGSDNLTAIGNSLNGVLIEGSSTRTVMGGPIPLGNVVAANEMNGIVVQDKASFFTTYNTFCGLAAFRDDPNLGNGLDGMLITSRGGNNLIRTNVIAQNGDDGIEVSGKAKDVRIAGNIIGLNTQGILPMGNTDNGVEIGGKAHDILVGGEQATFNIIPRNAISSNGNNGVAIVGKAHHNAVTHSYIGSDLTGQQGRGNTNAGVLLDSGTHSNLIGSPDGSVLTVISSNLGSGIVMNNTRDNQVMGSYIGLAADGTTARGNGANGVLITNGSNNNVIGNTGNASPNLIANNVANGVFVVSGTGNGIHKNSMYSNGALGIDLAVGANLNQAAPVLTSVQIVSSNLQITGTLISQPKKVFTLEFFANSSNEPSGKFFLGTQQVTTDALGEAEFVFLGPLPPSGANFITATATDPNDNTSEFSTVVS